MKSIKTVHEDETIDYRKENGEIHLEDGHTIEVINVYQEWWVNNNHTIEDRPTIEQANRDKEWMLNGEKISENEFLDFLKNKTKKEIQFE